MSEQDHLHEEPAQGSRFARAHHILLYFLAAVLAIWLLTGFYQVQTGQYAIVERLGQYLDPIDGRKDHGLHYHLPWPIDRVSLISVQQQYTLKVDAFNTSPEEYADFKLALQRQQNPPPPELVNALFDPYVVTGDKSVVHAEINVLFTVDDPMAWITSVSHEFHQDYDSAAKDDMRNQLFQQVAQRAIVSNVAHVSLEQLLQGGTTSLGEAIKRDFQEAMDHTNHVRPGSTEKTGVNIQSVTVSSISVPDAVKPAYSRLIDQQARKQTAIANAQADANGFKARARGEEQTLIADADAYNERTTQAAAGEAKRFSEVLNQYEQAPTLTRMNLAAETARTVYSQATRVYFAKPGMPLTIIVDPPQYDPTRAAASRPGQ